MPGLFFMASSIPIALPVLQGEFGRLQGMCVVAVWEQQPLQIWVNGAARAQGRGCSEVLLSCEIQH